MDLQRQEYPAMLASLQPSQAVDVFNLRSGHIRTLNEDIADWLQERRRIEEQYAQGLRALSRKKPPSESSELGVFSTPWQKIITSAEALADSHLVLARKIESDVEKPLRNFATQNREMQQISTMRDNLATLAKEAGGRGGGSSQWSSQSPFMFETLQAADESRINHLRNVLTQFQTHEVDQVERNRVTAEQCLNALLNVETADEIKTFAMRTSQGQLPAQRPSWRDRAGDRNASAAAAPSPLARRTSAQNATDASSDRSASPEKKGRLSGIKRLGTVLSRRNKKETPATPPSSRKTAARQNSNLAPIADNERSSVSRDNRMDSFGPNRGMQSSSTVPDPTSTAPRLERPALGEALSSDDVVRPAGQSSIDRNVQSGMTNGAAASGINELQEPLQPVQPGMAVLHDSAPLGPQDVTFSQPAAEYVAPTSTGSLFNAPLQAAAQHPQDFTILPGQHTTDTYTGPSNLSTYTTAAGIGAIGGGAAAAAAYFSQPTESSTPQFSRDAEGYNVRSTSSDPISQAEQESAGFGSSTTTQPYSMDIRNAPISEEGPDNETAMANVANTLRAQAGPAQAPKPRGRRDVRNTVFVPTSPTGSTANDYVSPQSAGGLASPMYASPLTTALYGGPSAQRSMSQDDNAGSDTQSVQSALSAGAGAPVPRHPDMHSPGLNSSIIETVSAWFENGAVTRSVVIGELALAYNQSNFPGAPTSESIRLENFHSLEKVAPNPSFIHQIPDRAGEYSVDVASIARTAVAFKYQVHLDSASIGRQAPIILSPSWKVEPTQTSVILNYSLNPAFLASQPQQQVVTISNVVITVYLGSGRATSCLSKPTGTFSREKGAIYWTLDDVVLRADQGPQRLLARFVTDSQGAPGRAEARWEIGGGQAERLGSGLHVSQLDGAGGAADSDPFADEENATAGAGSWKEVGMVRKLISGTYVSS